MIVVNAEYCPQNHRCPTLRVCPAGALQQEGFNAPFVDQELCIECGKCTYSCPVFSQVSEEASVPGNGHAGPQKGRPAASESLGGVVRRFRRGVRG